MPETPLLSICIPTFNRANLLRDCLSSLLIQLKTDADLRDQVQVVIADNDSDDETLAVITSSLEEYGSGLNVRVIRRSSNIGIIGNITKTAIEAEGHWVWLIGDDDVLLPGGVRRVVAFLARHDDLELVAMNVLFLPAEARQRFGSRQSDFQGSVDWSCGRTLRAIAGTEAQTGNRTAAGVKVGDLLPGPCIDLTPMYGLLIKRSLWASEYGRGFEGEPFRGVRSTYPTTYIAAMVLVRGPIDQVQPQLGLIAEPTVATFDIATTDFSWSRYQPLVAVLRLTQLLDWFKANGVDQATLEPYYRYQLTDRGLDLSRLLFHRQSVGGVVDAIRFAIRMRGYPLKVLKVFLVACSTDIAPFPLRVPLRVPLRLFRRLIAGRS